MPTKTPFLSLTLPAFQEFINSWDQPVNQNMEDIDAFLADLSNSLIATSTTATYASLRGTHNSLADRLAVSINPDGTLDLTASPDILALGTSSTQGTQAPTDDDPRGRFDVSDFEIYDARQPLVGGRFVPIGPGGAAGFPEEGIDAGIAMRVADFASQTEVVGIREWEPPRPAATGHVAGGATPLISAPGGANVVRIDGGGGGAAAIFNIDGYTFRLREQIDLDYSNLTPAPTTGNRVWIYVSRLESDYGDSEIEYDDDVQAAKDLRILQNGTDGSSTILSGLFESLGAKFINHKIGKVKAGDILVIETAPAGKNVIESIGSDTQLTVRGQFKQEAGILVWHIQDDFHPHIGAIETDSDPETQPLFVAGRVYIGRVTDAAVAPTDPVNFAQGGVFDSGWISKTTGTFPYTLTHNLGVAPSDVQIFLKTAANARVYPPMVVRAVVTEMSTANFPNPLAGDTSTAPGGLLFPSMRWNADTEDIVIQLLNATTDPAKPVAFFTDSGNTDITAATLVRVVARR